jgi:hypothetical protein
VTPVRFRKGDKVRLRTDYRLPVPSETLPLPVVRHGTCGEVLECDATSVWVKMEGVRLPIPFWTPGTFPEDFAQTTQLERLP